MPTVRKFLRASLVQGTSVAEDGSHCLDERPAPLTPKRVYCGPEGCSCGRSRLTGCPCRHLMALAAAGKRPLTMKDFDTRWLIEPVRFVGPEKFDIDGEGTNGLDDICCVGKVIGEGTMPACPSIVSKIVIARDMQETGQEERRFAPIELPELEKERYIKMEPEELWRKVVGGDIKEEEIDDYYVEVEMEMNEEEMNGAELKKKTMEEMEKICLKRERLSLKTEKDENESGEPPKKKERLKRNNNDSVN